MIIAFWILSLLAVGSAWRAVRGANLVHVALWLVLFFVSIAGLYVLLYAEFLAAVQILIYVGAVGILILFAIMLTRDVTGETIRRIESRGWWGGGLVTILLGWMIWFSIQEARLPEKSSGERHVLEVKALGKALIEEQALTLQVMALLLTAALLAAVAIAWQDQAPQKTKMEK